MKKRMYYQSMFRRQFFIKMLVLDYFYSASELFRVPIEMLIRKNFGERYFGLYVSVVIGLFLLAYPFLSSKYNLHGEMDAATLLQYFGTWYLYTATYIYCLFKRYREVRREPSVFDFARFSLSTGTIHPFFTERFLKDGKVNFRRIQTLAEPGVFFIAGAILSFLSQPIGYLLFICSIVYSLGYVAAYTKGDEFVMDKIDEMICNRELSATFVDGNESDTGFQFYGTRPNDEKLREDLYESMTPGDDEEDVIDPDEDEEDDEEEGPFTAQ